MWPYLFIIYLLLLAGVSLLGLLKRKAIDTPAQLILYCIILTTISETTARILALTIKNNLFVYHIYTPIQFLFISLFFNYSIPSFKKRYLGIVIGISGIIFSIFNSIFLQNPFTTFNTYFLAVESFLIITMTLCYFYSFLDNANTSKQFATADFWIACLLLVFWSFTFFTWLTGIALSLVDPIYMLGVRYMMYAINIITYTGFGLVFLFYRKLQPR